MTGESYVQFKSKMVVLSNGAKQILHPKFYLWFPSLVSRKDRVILSDLFLSRFHYFEMIKKIKQSGLKKITIIGGSHSGFSCAWTILNGPAIYQ